MALPKFRSSCQISTLYLHVILKFSIYFKIFYLYIFFQNITLKYFTKIANQTRPNRIGIQNEIDNYAWFPLFTGCVLNFTYMTALPISYWIIVFLCEFLNFLSTIFSCEIRVKDGLKSYAPWVRLGDFSLCR